MRRQQPTHLRINGSCDLRWGGPSKTQVTLLWSPLPAWPLSFGTPSFDPAEVSLTGALPKDGRATRDRAGCECLADGGSFGIGALGEPLYNIYINHYQIDGDWDSGFDPSLFWCADTYCMIVSTGETKRKTGLPFATEIQSWGWALHFQLRDFTGLPKKYHNLIDFVQLPSFLVPIRTS